MIAVLFIWPGEASLLSTRYLRKVLFPISYQAQLLELTIVLVSKGILEGHQFLVVVLPDKTCVGF